MTPFQQIAPDLVRDGLVKNKEWVPIAGERAAQCFSDPELQRVAAFLAALHPFAIDYIEQAPALVLAALGSRRLVTREGRMHLAQSFIVVCEPGSRLGKLMRLHGLAPELRALNGHVLKRQHLGLLRMLGRFPGTRLAPLMAQEPAQQSAWLAAAMAWTTHMRRHVDNPGFLLGWAIEKLRTPTYVPEIARLAEELGDSFNTDWSEKAARRACETARREALERHQRTLSSDTGSPIWAKSLDVSPFPTIATIGPYAFRALETLGSLESEGRSMHHCVGSYGNRATFKTSRLFSVLRNGRRVATLDVACVPSEQERTGRAFLVSELRGHCSAKPDLETLKAAWTFVDSVNLRLLVAYVDRPRAVKPAAAPANDLRATRLRIVDLLGARVA